MRYAFHWAGLGWAGLKIIFVLKSLHLLFCSGLMHSLFWCRISSNACANSEYASSGFVSTHTKLTSVAC